MSSLLSRKRILLLLGFILLIVAALFAQDYFQKDERIAKLNRDIQKLQKDIQDVEKQFDLEGLKTENARLENELTSAPTTFPKTVQSVEVTNLVYQSARKTGVELLKFQAIGTESKKFGSANYIQSTFRAQFRGQLSQVEALLQEIERGGFSTLTTNSLKLNPGPASWDVLLDINVISQSG